MNEMLLKNEILKSHSKYNTVRISQLIDQDDDLFKALINLYFDHKNMDLARKAAWILRHCVEQHPHLLNPFVKKLIKYLGTDGLHNAIKRNGLAVLEKVHVPEDLYGPLANICFEFVVSGKEPVAIKAYSMSILDKIGDKIPEIRHELKLIIQDLIPYESAGFKTRARKILLK